MAYRTKVRTVEAFRWQGQLYTDLPTWAHDLALAAPNGSAFYCYTRHGPVRANYGDWLILGDKEIYPCTDEEFKKRYEEVRDDAKV